MPKYIVLLRAVNVGGTGKLPMADLKAMCISAGFVKVQTYIASGNVVLETDASAANIKATLEESLKEYAGKPVGVVVRTLNEMRGVWESNPFPDAAPNRTVAIFADRPLPADAHEKITGRKEEELSFATREIYVHYGQGMADSKLKIAAAKDGTARNMNTIAKLIELGEKLS